MSTAARLTGYACALGPVLALGWGAGRAVGPDLHPAPTGLLRFGVTGPDGLPVTAFAKTPRDPDRVHVVVVRRDAAGFQRLDPTTDGDSTWHAPLTIPAPAIWQGFVDMTPTAEFTLPTRTS